jgi:nucleoside-diphosphate-sugar epimerase
VTIFHRGTHEIPEIPPEVDHIHGDPHFPETIADALNGRTFDLVVATYGRIRHLAEALVGRTGRFISVGGFPVYKGFMDPETLHPYGLPVPLPEDAPVAGETDNRFSYLIRSTEEAVLAAHPTAAHFRYPYVYGPYQVSPREWSVVRRILDRRPFIILADGGHNLVTRGFAANLAHALLLAIDQPEHSAGEVYNCGDEVQYTARQWVELVASAMGAELPVESLPHDLGAHGDSLLIDSGGLHRLMDLQKLQTQLGYHDVVSVPDAVAATATWLATHPPAPGGGLEEHIGDRFDYEQEDLLVGAYHAAVDQLRLLAPSRPEGFTPHSYAHPQAPGQLTDHRNR